VTAVESHFFDEAAVVVSLEPAEQGRGKTVIATTVRVRFWKNEIIQKGRDVL
jgi:hypothetical protein